MTSTQLELALEPPAPAGRPLRTPTEVDIERFRLQLERRIDGGLAELKLTRNRSTILTAEAKPRVEPRSKRAGPDLAKSNAPKSKSAASTPAPIALRIHRSFVFAPAPVLDAVAAYAGRSLKKRGRGQALEIIRCYFEQVANTRDRPRRKVTLEPRGRCYDLVEICDSLNSEYFDGTLAVAITWGRKIPRQSRRKRGRQHSVQLGSYAAEENLIRLHRVLDDPAVPRFVVESVVYHELLHAALPAVKRGRRRIIHPPEFRRRELEFRHLKEAEAWIDTHLFELLRAPRQ